MRITVFIVFFLSFITLKAQKGENTYEFLNLPNSAHVGALGGYNVSHYDPDLGLTNNNPALLRDTMVNQLSLNYINYIADINFGYASYAWKSSRYGTFAVGIQYINYGTFDHTDATGFELGTFTAQESAVGLMWSYQLRERWNAGVNLKQIFSSFEQYNSYGIVLDGGINYLNASKYLSVGLAIKNLGTQVTTYTDNNFESMPFEIQAGITKKLAHAPFRFSLTAIHLQTPDLSYKSELTQTSAFDGQTSNKISFGNNVIRHLVIGVEFIPFKNFFLASGYNFQRRYELANDNRLSTVGVSWGFGIKISKFKISYGSARYHLAGTSNHFSISTNLSSFY